MNILQATTFPSAWPSFFFSSRFSFRCWSLYKILRNSIYEDYPTNRCRTYSFVSNLLIMNVVWNWVLYRSLYTKLICYLWLKKWLYAVWQTIWIHTRAQWQPNLLITFKKNDEKCFHYYIRRSNRWEGVSFSVQYIPVSDDNQSLPITLVGRRLVLFWYRLDPKIGLLKIFFI